MWGPPWAGGSPRSLGPENRAPPASTGPATRLPQVADVHAGPFPGPALSCVGSSPAPALAAGCAVLPLEPPTGQAMVVPPSYCAGLLSGSSTLGPRAWCRRQMPSVAVWEALLS